MIRSVFGKDYFGCDEDNGLELVREDVRRYGNLGRDDGGVDYGWKINRLE